MSKIKLKIIPIVAFALFATQAYASDVYISYKLVAVVRLI